MLFSEVMQSLKPDGDSWTAAVPEDWMQGRSVFGGLQAAFALRAMRALVPAGIPLRTLQTTFMAPVAERFDDLPLQGWRVDAQLIAASGGYTNQSVMVWGPGGVPVALSRQSMVVFG